MLQIKNKEINFNQDKQIQQQDWHEKQNIR